MVNGFGPQYGNPMAMGAMPQPNPVMPFAQGIAYAGVQNQMDRSIIDNIIDRGTALNRRAALGQPDDGYERRILEYIRNAVDIVLGSNVQANQQPMPQPGGYPNAQQWQGQFNGAYAPQFQQGYVDPFAAMPMPQPNQGYPAQYNAPFMGFLPYAPQAQIQPGVFMGLDALLGVDQPRSQSNYASLDPILQNIAREAKRNPNIQIKVRSPEQIEVYNLHRYWSNFVNRRATNKITYTMEQTLNLNGRYEPQLRVATEKRTGGEKGDVFSLAGLQARIPTGWNPQHDLFAHTAYNTGANWALRRGESIWDWGRARSMRINSANLDQQLLRNYMEPAETLPNIDPNDLQMTLNQPLRQRIRGLNNILDQLQQQPMPQPGRYPNAQQWQLPIQAGGYPQNPYAPQQFNLPLMPMPQPNPGYPAQYNAPFMGFLPYDPQQFMPPPGGYPNAQQWAPPMQPQYMPQPGPMGAPVMPQPAPGPNVANGPVNFGGIEIG